ncbi:MAG: hypothetical protein K2O88_03065, partial [Paramuribaculum sp.]|nr:hypothetical protein [Paramuribaculum sp.]
MVTLLGLSAAASSMRTSSSMAQLQLPETTVADSLKLVETLSDSTIPRKSLSHRRRASEKLRTWRDSTDSIHSMIADSLARMADVMEQTQLSSQERKRTRLNRDTTDTASHTTGKRIMRVKTDLDNVVDIYAKDSMVLRGQNNAYLYGESNVTYGKIKLDAERIEMDMNNSTVYAVGVPDSTGELTGSP